MKGENRTWLENTLAHRPQEIVPYNFDFSPPAREKVESHYGSPIEELLNFPLRMTCPKSIKPLYAKPEKYGKSIIDEFGVVWSTNAIDRGAPIGQCLHEPDLSNYLFPDPSAPYRFEEIGEWCRRNEGNFRIIWVGDLWERATFMRGMDHILMDLMLHPSFVGELLRGLADQVLQTMTILFDRFSFEGVALSDDYGTQRSMIMSPKLWRKFIKPLLSEIYGLARSNGRTMFHHSCGSIDPIIPDLIEVGLDILHPIQPEAMDVFKLKREFGRDLTFCGGIRTQELLPNGSAQEVREEVRRLKDQLGNSGGYILETGITVQADVPLDNLVAMIDEAINGTG